MSMTGDDTEGTNGEFINHVVCEKMPSCNVQFRSEKIKVNIPCCNKRPKLCLSFHIP